MTVKDMLQHIEHMLERASIAGGEVEVYINDSENGYIPLESVEFSFTSGTKTEAASTARIILHSEASE